MIERYARPEMTAIWSPEEPRVVLNGISLCGCVDDREHLFEMFLNQLRGIRDARLQ